MPKNINMKNFANKTVFQYILPALVFLVLYSGCLKNEEFTVYYYYPSVELFCAPTCESLKRECNRFLYDDTIYIDADILEQIKKGIINAKSIYNPSIEPHIYVKMENLDLYLDDTNNECWIKKGDNKRYSAILNNRTAYLIKWKSGYYNHLEYDDLNNNIENLYDSGLARYGIPSDYKYDKGIVGYTTYFDGKDSVLEEIPSDRCTSKVLVRVK